MATMEKPKPKVETQAAAPKKKTAEEAVQELEQRLAMLGGPSAPATTAPEGDALGFATPAAPPAPPVEAAKPEMKGGKNALLVSSPRVDFANPDCVMVESCEGFH